MVTTTFQSIRILHCTETEPAHHGNHEVHDYNVDVGAVPSGQQEENEHAHLPNKTTDRK